jgi:hypothetical protein
VTRVRREQTTAAAAQSSDQDANYHAGHPGGAVDEVDDSIEGPADDEVAA